MYEIITEYHLSVKEMDVLIDALYKYQLECIGEKHMKKILKIINEILRKLGCME